jgi:hypothetical protein
MQLKDLKSLLKLLRSQGVLEYTSEGITIKLSDNYATEQPFEAPAGAEVIPEEREMTEEERLYFSSTSPNELVD